MDLENLVASQPTDNVQSDDNVMDNEASSAPQDNADGSTHEDTSTPIDNVDGQEHEDDARFKAMQKRIDKLTAKSKGAEEELIRERARAEAYENMRQADQPQTIQDLDVNGLNSFITRAESDPDLEQHLPEARLELQKRLIQEELNSFKQEQLQLTNEQRYQAQTNEIIGALSGDRLQDQSSEYYNNTMSFMADLDSDSYSGVNVKQILAVALAENQHLKNQAQGQTMSQRVEKNRNRNDNTLQSNNRAVNGNNSDDIKSFLSEQGPLRRSNQAGQGSLKEALSRLGTVKGFKGE